MKNYKQKNQHENNSCKLCSCVKLNEISKNKVERIEKNVKKIMKEETDDSEINSLKKYQRENSEEIKAINSKISALDKD